MLRTLRASFVVVLGAILFQLFHFLATHHVKELSDVWEHLPLAVAFGILLELLNIALELKANDERIQALAHQFKEDREPQRSTREMVNNELAPKINALPQLHVDVHNGFQDLHTVLNMFVRHRQLADVMSGQLVRVIDNILSTRVDRISINAHAAPSTVRDHELVCLALTKMLKGLVEQMQHSTRHGLFVESIAPGPDDEMTVQYPQFVAEAVRASQYFMGVSLMPPQWWVHDDRFGLRKILELQRQRLQQLGDKRPGVFARIVVMRPEFLSAAAVFELDAPVERRLELSRTWRDKPDAHAEPMSYGVEVIELYGTATTLAQFAELNRLLLARDPAVIELRRLHKEAGVLLGVILAGKEVYEFARDFVYVVDEHGFESLITSIGFEEILKKNNITSPAEMGERFLTRFKGFVEGRIYYYPNPPYEKLSGARHLWETLVAQLPIPTNERHDFLLYTQSVRAPWEQEVRKNLAG